MKKERLVTATAARRNKIVRHIESVIRLIFFIILLCVISGIVNHILDYFGIGMIR